MNQSFPKIGVVIIGIDESEHLAECIRSIESADYPKDLIEVVYVDGGSKDNSPEIARSFDKVDVIDLKNPHPTPGRGRNAGWKSLDTPVIQFLDADTILNPRWFKNAVTELDGSTVAVCGLLEEKYPDKNLFHVLADMEWKYEIGPCRYFGGGVLLNRKVLEKTDGFDEELIAGEDPELSYRIRQRGWQIIRLNFPMVTHDINMNSLGVYLKRAFRSGYAYAEISLRFINKKEKIWLRKLIGILGRTILPFGFFLAGFVSGYIWLGIMLGLLALFRPLFRIFNIKRTYKRSWNHSLLYALHFILVDYPQFCGLLRYFWGRIMKNPLRNKVYEG